MTASYKLLNESDHPAQILDSFAAARVGTLPVAAQSIVSDAL